jgi:hypothetical protein
MPYTDSQKQYYNTKPSTQLLYSVITFDNAIAGKRNLLACGKNGPYQEMSFNVNGVMELFTPVYAEVPAVTTQDPLSNDIGIIKLARVSSHMSAYLEQIARGALSFAEKVINVRIAIYEQPIAPPVYVVDAFAGVNGITIGTSDVSVKIQYANTLKSRQAAFYSPQEYIGLQYG